MKLTPTWSRLLLSAAIAAGTLWGGTGSIPHAYAEGPGDPAPELQPSGTANGKKVLFDNTHGQTAGAADWVIDGAFSDFARALSDKGYYVKELRKSSPIGYTDLSGYDVVVLGEANIPYKTQEQAALLQYVQNGGSLFFIADHYNADRNKNRWDSSEVFNGYRRGAWTDPAKGMGTEERSSAAMQDVASSDWLASHFGIRFRYNAIGNVNANHIVPPNQAFGITSGVSAVAMHAGSTLAIVDPAKAKGIVYLPATTAKWNNAVDQGVYAGGGIAEGPYAAVAKVGQGKAGFIGDSSPVEDATPKYVREETGSSKTTYDGFKEQDDAALLVNMIDWLAVRESYTSLNQVSGLVLDQPTPLLAMEEPAASTEPQSEPWSAPAAGYKWWDSATFKPGSFGYTSGGGGGEPGTGPLFISEYVEGSSYNKAIEIYNGTDAPVSLSGYTLSLSNASSAISLSGTLAGGGVYVVAHSSAASGITSKADLLTNALSFNGDDSVTLKYNGAVLDVVGTAGTLFGENKTLVRKSSVTTGSSSYSSGQWEVYPADTFTHLGAHTAQAAPSLTAQEGFESGSKTSYPAGSVTLSSGIWHFDNALLGNLSTDRKNGAVSARVKAPGSIAMSWDVTGAKSVKVSHALFGNDTGAAWKLQKSVDNGGTWTDVTGTISSSSSLTEHTAAVSVSGPVRFRILVSGPSGARLNIDDVKIFN